MHESKKIKRDLVINFTKTKCLRKNMKRKENYFFITIEAFAKIAK